MTTSSAGITSRCTTPSSAGGVGGVGGSGGGGEGDEHIARCVALERAYVHEVYEQFQEAPRTRPWPRINQFLQDLEPGSLVCDVGCGNGKYLNVNQSIYKVGVDRCSRLTEIAREKENEVLLCDNLALPFRDESFDAVLSVAVVHHFATTERRVGALRELARLLRIGGRLVISVWAMEQRHRRFESQDVLVPWHRVPSPPQNGPRVNQHHNLSTPSLELTSTTNTSEEDVLPPYHAYTQTSDSDSNRSFRNISNGGVRKRGRTRHKGRSIDPNRSSSPSSSSLSSPNETCYSFVRRAIQKLAGGKRGGSRHRPWFLDSWSYCSKETNQPRYDPDGCEDCDCEDIHDLPIELRRIEEDDVVQSKQSLVKNNSTDLYRGGHKSKSLGDIQTVKQESIIRSRSNVSNLKCIVTPIEEPSKETNLPKQTEHPIVIQPTTRPKPKLVKQKKSLNEEDGEDLDKPLNQRDVVEALPDFRLMHSHYHNRRGNVFKQSSMNEELLSTERLREKERVRKNIQKQASLNEELIYRRYRTLDSLRDSIFSVSTSKRFQLIKNGFTTKLKNSTNNIEKVAGTSLKNGFVRILQGWKTESMSSEKLITEENGIDISPQNKQSLVSTIIEEKISEPNERRHSREEGSDSSKDSSLQSDTSVDSEDSFASVIFVPKQESQDAMSPTPLSPAPTSPRVKSSSGPTSPRLKQSSCPTSPRLKQMPLSVYPLLKQPTSPKTAQQLKNVPSGGKVLIYSQSTPCKTNNNCTSPKSNDNGNNCSDNTSPPKTILKSPEQNLETVEEKSEILSDECEESPPPKTIKNPSSIPVPESSKSFQDNIQKYKSLAEKYKIQKIPDFRPSVSRALGFDKNRTERLKQIRELLNQRPGFGRNTRSAFPIVRRSSTQVSGRTELVAKSLPRLLSLELFNPETDDVDSDSSGVSSPDSVDSVISVEVPDNTNKDTLHVPKVVYDNTESEDKIEDKKLVILPVHKDDKDLLKLDLLCSPERETIQLSPSSKSLLEAAANVASSLDNAVGAVIQSSPRLKRKQFDEIERSKILEVVTNDFDDNGVQSDEYCNVNNVDKMGCLVQKNKNECTHFPFDEVVQVEESEEPSKESFETNDRVSIDWENQCYKHLAEFAEQISENVLKEIDQYREESKRHKSLHGLENLPLDKFNDPYIHKLSEEIQDLTRLSAELIKERNLYLAKLNSETYSSDKVTNSVVVDDDEPIDKRNDCDSELCEKSPVLEQSTSEHNILSVAQDSITTVIDRNDSVQSAETETKSSPLRTPDRDVVLDRNNDLNNSNSVIEQGSNTNVVNTELKSRECSNVDIKKLNANNNNSSDSLSVVTGGAGQLLSGLSQESSDAGDVSERTGSSDWSQGDSRRDTNSAGVTTDGGSTASLGSCKDWNRPRRIADGRSSSDDVPESRRSPLVRQHASVQEPPEPADEPHVSLSDTSQESLPSDPAGGSITYHRYYHVFREGELDQLIEKYVENLHIISSYYDHASWCVVAEKVQVWTI